jgi:hypothetical protein
MCSNRLGRLVVLAALLAPFALAGHALFKDKAALLFYDEDLKTLLVVRDPETANYIEILSGFWSNDSYHGPTNRPCLRIAIMTRTEVAAEPNSEPLTWSAEKVRSRLLYFPMQDGHPAISQRIGAAPARPLRREAAKDIEERLIPVTGSSGLQDCEVRLTGPVTSEVAGAYRSIHLQRKSTDGLYEWLGGGGGYIEFTLTESGEVRGIGRLSEELNWLWPRGDFNGRWTLNEESSVVALDLRARAIVNELRFRADGLTLSAEATMDGATLFVTFERQDPPHVR